MTKTELIKKISQKVDISRPEVRKVIDAFEDAIMEIIATEDFIELSFAKIEGYTKPPRKITGSYAGMKQFQANGNWSIAKVGFPKCTFTKEAKDYLVMDTKKYFEMPEHRYTTNAYRFRKDNNLEEIPEYKDLPQEKIDELCDKADLIEAGIKTKGQLGDYRHKKQLSQNGKKNNRNSLVLEDIKKQLESGVPKDQIVFRDPEELIKEYNEMEKERQESFAKAHPRIDKKRDEIIRNRQYVD